MNASDTIAAISTPAGEGGIGIIRISGPDALKTGLKVFSLKNPPKALQERRLHYGYAIDPSGVRPLDDGFMVYMKGPKTYTGADVVELYLHGSPLVLKKTLEAVLRSGARAARPGEFTRQAFLNGRMDLASAEAVADIIRAQTEAALIAARGRLEGKFSKKVKGIKDILIGLLANIEAELDFAEDEVDGLKAEEIMEGLDRASNGLKRMLSTYEEGMALREGVKVLILGRPNTGKSSLLNILLQEERAIVTPIPGTTRDVIEEAVNIRGIPVHLMDTAGLRETADFIESIGVKLATERIKTARMILFVVDSSLSDFTEDIRLLEAASGKKVLIVANKADLVDDKRREAVKEAFGGYKAVFISALKDEGIDGLKDAICGEAAGRHYGLSHDAEPGELVTSVRHKDALQTCLEGVERAKEAAAKGIEREFIASEIRWSLNRLSEITGEVTTEEVLDKIFSEFCIGK